MFALPFAGRAVAVGVDAVTTWLHADQTHLWIADEALEHADGVAPTPDTGDHRIRTLGR